MILSRRSLLSAAALLCTCLLCLCNQCLCNQSKAQGQALTEHELNQVDESIARANQWILSSQRSDGAFPTMPFGQPAITSFGVLALMAQGDMPDQGKHGAQLASAIDYVLSTQKPNGLLAAVGPGGSKISHNVKHQIGQTAVYNHAISALMLSEAYATTTAERSQQMQEAIEKALKVTLDEQRRAKRRKVDHGGWRYLDQFGSEDSDLSVIGWQLKFLRSAKNAGFDVPVSAIDDAVGCVRRHFSRNRQQFDYCPGTNYGSRAMTGAGILALSHAGLHNTPEAKLASERMLRFSFNAYNNSSGGLDRYHYSLFQCTQAAYQLGDDYWQKFHPQTYRTLLANQNPDGSWDAERTNHGDGQYGSVYTTALVVLSLSAPNQLLPIYQR